VDPVDERIGGSKLTVPALYAANIEPWLTMLGAARLCRRHAAGGGGQAEQNLDWRPSAIRIRVPLLRGSQGAVNIHEFQEE
jgi:hypothetical protein